MPFQNWRKPLRIGVFLFLVFLTIVILFNAGDYRVSILDKVAFHLHEAGHVFFQIITLFMGRFLILIGGTVLEVGFPLGFAFLLFKNQAFFSGSCFIWWAGKIFIGVGAYMADARAQKIVLFPHMRAGVPGDWYYIFESLGLLNFDVIIGTLVKIFGVVTMVAALWLAGYFAWHQQDFVEEPEEPNLL